VQENKDAPLRVDPKGAYGPHSCKSGFVWREAFNGDVVCVTPEIRSIVREENLLAPLRLLSSTASIADTGETDEVATGPWLCGEETTDIIAKTRAGHVIDREGHVWTYRHGRAAAKLAFAWRADEKSSVVTAEALAKRYAGATRAGRDLEADDVVQHLPLIAEAAKTEAAASDQVDTMTNGIVRLYCLLEEKKAGTYREIILDQRGALVRVNASPAARELVAWFQPRFWIVD
jgi:hypothetical protein